MTLSTAPPLVSELLFPNRTVSTMPPCTVGGGMGGTLSDLKLNHDRMAAAGDAL